MKNKARRECEGK